jgi:hypothetical protein
MALWPMGYVPRRVVPLPLRESAGWRLKPTVVLAQGREVDDALVEAAFEAAHELLPDARLDADHYRVGIVLVHFGMRYDFVLVGYWRFESELRYATFMRASSDSTRLAPLPGAELATDVWDLSVLAFEREAWVQRVLRASDEDASGEGASGEGASGEGASGEGADDEARLAAYLAERLDATL